MPWNQTDEVVESKKISLAEAMKMASEQPADPTVAVETKPVTVNGKLFLQAMIPLDVNETDCRIKHETLKSGQRKTKCNISCLTMIPTDTVARVTNSDGTMEFSVKANTPLRFTIGLDLRNGRPVAAAVAAPANRPGQQQAKPASN